MTTPSTFVRILGDATDEDGDSCLYYAAYPDECSWYDDGDFSAMAMLRAAAAVTLKAAACSPRARGAFDMGHRIPVAPLFFGKTQPREPCGYTRPMLFLFMISLGWRRPCRSARGAAADGGRHAGLGATSRTPARGHVGDRIALARAWVKAALHRSSRPSARAGMS